MAARSEEVQLSRLRIEGLPKFLPALDRVKVLRVLHGDTLVVGAILNGKAAQHALRLVGIDTADRRSKKTDNVKCAEESRAFLQSLVEGRVLQVSVHGTDKFGKVLVTATDPDTPTDTLNDIMVREGLALARSGSTKRSDVDWRKVRAAAQGANTD